MKFLIDENLSPQFLDYFPDAVHIYGTVQAGASDRTILRFADENNYVIISADTDFGALLAANGASRP